MKLLIFLCFFLLSGCAKQLPEYPAELNEFFVVDIPTEPLDSQILKYTINFKDLDYKTSESATCLQFNIVERNPLKFKFIKALPIKDCHAVTGYHADKQQKLWNYIDDVSDFAEKNNCYKKP